MDATRPADLSEADVAPGNADETAAAPSDPRFVPTPYNPMTIDVNVTQGNRVVSLLDLRARRGS